MTAEFFAASNVLIVAGKGGVGKTTVGASLGIAAARSGYDVLLIELEGHSSLSTLFGLDRLSYEEVTLDIGSTSGGRLRARQIKPDDALTDYLDRAGLGPLTGRLSRSGAMEVVVTAAPGIRDLLTLGKIRQLEQAGEADLIVVDAPAAGHALTFLTAAAGLSSSAASGPVRDQADLVLEMFADDRRCQVVLVTLPEETPITETIETAFRLEEDVGIKLAPVVVNGVWSPIRGLAAALKRTAATKERAVDNGRSATDRAVAVAGEAARYRLARIEDQNDEMARLAQELPLDQLRLPFLFRTELGVDGLGMLADAFAEQLSAAGS
ncbi:MAG: ArsA family ATPase [Acidimicrobiales bacterium]